MLRSGDEPLHARSPLRLRLGLAIWALLWAVGGTAGFAAAGKPWWAAACGGVLALILVDVYVVIHRIRQGPHFQPGRDVPPYEPVDNGRRSGRPGPPRP